ncbi:hypothetical protein FNH45_12975 [Salmonella enterica subsp. houtenae]|nr:hypothetical protein [Salmonella enterica subsp. houtenae]HDC2133757.1 hypothetical protein [Salmonella enterica]
MEKSMAGQGAAGALLLAGLMMSAGAMAASGDPVQGGSGSVTINVPIVTSTCSVAVPTEVNFEPIDKQSIKGVNTVSAIKTMDITFSGCSGSTLLMSTSAHDISSVNSTMGNFSSGDPDHALGYTMYVPDVAEIGKYVSTSMDNTKPKIIKPNSDSYVIASNILLKSTGNSVSNLGSAVSGGFDYTFTYQ